MRDIDTVIIHCSATKPSQDIGVQEIRRWHIEENGFFDVGYHFVIRRDGSIENGRPLEKIGAHCKGRNQTSLGICLVGGLSEEMKSENNFTHEQMESLKVLIKHLKAKFSLEGIYGHNHFSPKECPCFEVGSWLRKNELL